MGSPLSMVVMGVDHLDSSIDFFHGIMGFDALWRGTLSGPNDHRFWALDPETHSDAALIGLADEDYGRILLIDCRSPNKMRIRPESYKSTLGLYNLNFYVENCFSAVEALSDQGIDFWSSPAKPNIDEDVGGTIEAVFEGPSGVAINLVQLVGGRPDTMIGRLREQISKHASSVKGFTPVSTSTVSVKQADRAFAFYHDILGMQLIIDQVSSNPAANAMLGRPRDAESRVMILDSGHAYGKILLSQPINYHLHDVVPDAHLPNIGYVAQSFFVSDLREACHRTLELGGKIEAPPVLISVPHTKNRDCALVRCPGSGALVQLIAK